jgi:hypothetical protein
MNCRKCFTPIPKPRLKALPETRECVTCSSEEQNMVRAVITGKTTYCEVEVIKNKATKEYLNSLIGKGRRGFGSMLYRSTGSASATNRMPAMANPMRKRPICTAADFDRVGEQAMQWLRLDMPAKADHVLQEALNADQINGAQFRQLQAILCHMKNLNCCNE